MYVGNTVFAVSSAVHYVMTRSDVAHVRKDTRLSPPFRESLGTRLHNCHILGRGKAALCTDTKASSKPPLTGLKTVFKWGSVNGKL